MKNSKIEWTESTWNPTTGCTKISSGCANCYAEKMAKRLQAMGQPNYKNGFQVTCHEHALELPLQWRKPQVIFVNSMSDLFHEEIPEQFIIKVFDIMRRADWHRFQILTKREKRLQELAKRLPWPDHVLMGVTVENQACTSRIAALQNTPAKAKFLSMEPLLEPITNLELTGIDWVIVGGESGIDARPMKEEWVIDIKRQCDLVGVPFFFKQWGGVNKKKAGRTLLGRTWDAVPKPLMA